MSIAQAGEFEGLSGGRPEAFRFVLPGRIEYRDAARGFVSFVCRQLIERGVMTDEIRVRVESAFIEAYTNAVVHGHANAAEIGVVDIGITVDQRAIELQVTDEGVGFHPDEVVEPDLEALPESGMGLFIMRSFMDDVQYRREGTKNVLTLTQRLKPTSGGSQ